MSVEILNKFRYKSDGSWTCLERCTIEHPKGQIQVTADSRFMPGTVFLGVDVAAYLNEMRQAARTAPAGAPGRTR